MKSLNKYVLALLLVFSVTEGFGQGKDSTFFFDTFAVSVNSTYAKGGEVDSRAGFGLGLYRTILPQKRVNLLLGLEYNYTSRFTKRLFKGKYSTAYDVRGLLIISFFQETNEMNKMQGINFSE